MSGTDRPRLRGVSHAIAFFPAAAVAIVLVILAPTARASIAAGVYGFGLCCMYGISALYHRITWTTVGRQRMRRLDHGAIFLMIAGTGTPLFLLGVGGDIGAAMLAGLWIGAVLGILQSVLQGKRPKWIVALPYVVVGWFGCAALPGAFPLLGVEGIVLFLGGGVIYTLGAACYAFRRPNPLPTVFGYHEVFHALVIVASIFHFVAIQDVVLAV